MRSSQTHEVPLEHYLPVMPVTRGRSALPKGTLFTVFWLMCIGTLVMFDGYMSGSAPRHFVQLLPIVFAIAMVLRLPALAAYIAMGVFVFWVFNMDFIWSAILGQVVVPDTAFPNPAFVAMILFAPLGVLGLTACIRIAGSMSLHNRVTLVLFGLGIQYVFVTLSFLPVFNR